MKKILPPDPEGMNDNRAAWAAAALRHFQCMSGADDEDAPGDLLCDLIHWCDRHNFDFDAALDRARGHYEEETRADPIEALERAILALNTAPRFRVPSLDSDSYAIASFCDRVVVKAKGGEP